ncbi:MAG TPA: hypothetical protein VGK32_07575 [Vicinamibacterales bacterium]|jgi:hypothetical protein
MRTSFLVVISLLTVVACGGTTSSPATPTPTSPATFTSLSGTWTGTSSDTSGQDKLTWTLTQNGNAMAGTMNIADTGRSMMGNGSMQGTVNGSTMTFHMTVPNGGFNGMMSSCSMGVDGQATMSSDGHTMTGTYSGAMSGMMSGGMMNQSCGGAMNNGQFTLTR